jgi:hypothetical protein
MTANPADLVSFGLLGVWRSHRIWPSIQNPLDVPKYLES